MDKIKFETKDHTPTNFSIKKASFNEELKSALRQIIYPAYTYLNNKILRTRHKYLTKYQPDKILLGHRGSDYRALRKRVNKFYSIKGKDILIIGCGTGRDIESWLKFKPNSITAVDLFNYERAWGEVKERFSNDYKHIDIEFLQLDVEKQDLPKKFDIIASDAVFEHLRNFDFCIQNLTKALKCNGIVYATYGPLWHCWGGDHIGGEIKDGYNHLLLPNHQYKEYLKNLGEFEHDEGDGRTWIYNDLFSYLHPKQYLIILEKHNLKKEYLSFLLEKRSLEFKRQEPEKFSQLEKKYSEESLIVTGMTIVFRRID